MNVQAFWKWIGPGGDPLIEARSQCCSHQISVARGARRIYRRIRKVEMWNMRLEIQVGDEPGTRSELAGDEHRQGAAWAIGQQASRIPSGRELSGHEV